VASLVARFWIASSMQVVSTAARANELKRCAAEVVFMVQLLVEKVLLMSMAAL
jgi:hypothetical protein